MLYIKSETLLSWSTPSSVFLLHLCLCLGRLPPSHSPGPWQEAHCRLYRDCGNKKQVHSLHFPLSSVGSGRPQKHHHLLCWFVKGVFAERILGSASAGNGSTVTHGLTHSLRPVANWFHPSPTAVLCDHSLYLLVLSCLCSTTTRLLEETIQLTAF